MPRLIDKLDAAVGLVPEFLDHGIDCLVQQPGPTALVAEDGTYNAGWYESFDGALNVSDSMALDMAFQRWFHLSFDAGRYFVVCNIADFTRAGNIALLVVDKNTGKFERASVSPLRPGSRITVDEHVRVFEDRKTRSFIRMDESGELVEFSIHVGELHFSGAAHQAIGPPLVQVSRFQRGRGCLQWFGCIALKHGVLTLPGQVVELPPGSLGSYDRTVGHQRGIQAWNWIAASGFAVDDCGVRTQLGVQVAVDREHARPRVDTQKSVVWAEGAVFKVPGVSFAYTKDASNKQGTSEWRISSAESDAGFAMSLSFEPGFHRHETRFLWLVNADFHQYYGVLSGWVRLGGREFCIEPMFAVAEESLLEL